jgi:hypothetical protein
MKKLLFFYTLIVSLYSCDTKTTSESATTTNILENFSLSADTVQINVGEELFNPGGYYLRDYSEDGSKGYFFYPENEIHVIDLNNLKLIKRHILEEDGPNAIPKYLNDMQALPDEEVFLANYAQTGVYKISGEKVAGYKLQPENVEGIPNDAGYSLANSIHISPDKTTLVSLPNTFGEPIEGLAIINTQEMSAKILDLPALELTNNFQIVFREGNGAMAGGDYQRIQFLNGKFLIYSGATANIYSYDWKSDSLQLYSFPHQLVPVAKTGKVTKNMDSRESYYAANREMRKQITFGEFFWDDTRESYFRFADMNSQYNDEGRFVKSDMYLFSYDKEMILTGETKVEGLKYMPYSSFMKNGKLHIPWVQEENPAFIVYTFNF